MCSTAVHLWPPTMQTKLSSTQDLKKFFPFLKGKLQKFENSISITYLCFLWEVVKLSSFLFPLLISWDFFMFFWRASSRWFPPAKLNSHALFPFQKLIPIPLKDSYLNASEVSFSFFNRPAEHCTEQSSHSSRGRSSDTNTSSLKSIIIPIQVFN